MSSSTSPGRQPTDGEGSSPTNAVGGEAAEASAPPPAAAEAAASNAAAPGATAQPKPADSAEKLAELEQNWVGFIERVTEHVDAAQERLQRQLADEAEQGWQPPRYQCSGLNVTPHRSAAGMALSWWQYSDRCLNTAVARGEDLKLLQLYQPKFRGALERIKREQEAAMAAAAVAGGQRATAGGQDGNDTTSPASSTAAAGPALSRSEIASRKWMLGGLAAAAARVDALLERTAALAAQAQEVRDAAKKTAADKLAVYLRDALQAEEGRRKVREALAARIGGNGLGAAQQAGHGGQLHGGALPFGLFPGYQARPAGFSAGLAPGAGGGGASGLAPAGRHGAGMFDQFLVRQAEMGQMVNRAGARLDQFAQQLERQLGQQGRLVQQLAQVRGAAGAAALPPRPAPEERPPEWAPPEQRQQAEAEHSRRARLRAMLDTEEDEDAGSSSQEGSDGEAAAERAEQWEQGHDSAAAAADLASQPSVLSHLSASPTGSEAARLPSSEAQQEEEPTDEERMWAALTKVTWEMEEGQQALTAKDAATVAWPVTASRQAQAGSVGAASLAADGGAGQLTAQQRAYVAAQRRRFAKARQGSNVPPAACASPPRASPPAAPRPASWQPRLPLAPRSVLPPSVELARGAVAQEGPKGRPVPTFGLENSFNCTTAGSGLYGKVSRPSALPPSASKAASVAAIERAEAAGWRNGWPAPSLAGGGGFNLPAGTEAMVRADLDSTGRCQSKLHPIRRLFPGLSCFLPEVKE